MSDDLYRLTHEKLADEYLELHPECGWDVAYDRTALQAYDSYVDQLAAQADYARMRAKEGNA